MILKDHVAETKSEHAGNVTVDLASAALAGAVAALQAAADAAGGDAAVLAPLTAARDAAEGARTAALDQQAGYERDALRILAMVDLPLSRLGTDASDADRATLDAGMRAIGAAGAERLLGGCVSDAHAAYCQAPPQW